MAKRRKLIYRMRFSWQVFVLRDRRPFEGAGCVTIYFSQLREAACLFAGPREEGAIVAFPDGRNQSDRHLTDNSQNTVKAHVKALTDNRQTTDRQPTDN